MYGCMKAKTDLQISPEVSYVSIVLTCNSNHGWTEGKVDNCRLDNSWMAQRYCGSKCSEIAYRVSLSQLRFHVIPRSCWSEWSDIVYRIHSSASMIVISEDFYYEFTLV